MLDNTTQRGLLMDFAGTLFLPLGGQRWATAAARNAGTRLTYHDSLELAALLDSRFHRVRDPGPDLSPAAHRQSMLPALESLTADKALANSLYDIQFTDGFWHPRHGAQDVLQAARQRGMRIIVVSNVPWDIRPLFMRAGLGGQINGFALSFEVGAEKPDQLIFKYALDLAGCAPSDAVLVGDDPATDSGALQLGIPVILVPHSRNSTDTSLPTVAAWLRNANQAPES
jgi:HAD superfamily hydrolase (TIGR01509 family)